MRSIEDVGVASIIGAADIFTLSNPSARGGSGHREVRETQAIFTDEYYTVRAPVEETPASRLAAPRDHAPLGHVAVLRLRDMTLIEAM